MRKLLLTTAIAGAAIAAVAGSLVTVGAGLAVASPAATATSKPPQHQIVVGEGFNVISVTANCPSGTVATGGGYLGTAAPIASEPLRDPSNQPVGWEVIYASTQAQAFAEAICEPA